MKTIKLVIAGLLFLICANPIVAQQDPHFTQYFDNMLFVNPAYAGSNNMLNMTALHREQWVGFEGAPRSTTFSIHSPVSYESVGLGLTAVNDMSGPVRQTMIYGDFSYSVKFKNSKSKLAFGIKAGLNTINVSRSQVSTTVENDPKLAQNIVNTINPNFGFGVYYHNPKFFVGMSVPRFVERSYDKLNPTNLEKRHLFGIVGGIIDLNANWKFRPTAQVNMTVGAPVSIDLSAAGIFQDKFWVGAMYRWESAAGAFFQFQLNPQFRVGLASDFGVTRINRAAVGTFEVMLSYDFSFKKDGIRSPRYF
jgi:type IX secretion system PorP/SprF family membrane protein